VRGPHVIASKGRRRQSLPRDPLVTPTAVAASAWLVVRHIPPGSLGAMDVPEIDVAELARVRADGAPLIDVREPDEYTTAHVPGATLIPLATVPDELARVPADGTVYVICGVGARSLRAAEFYRAQGIDAVNVAGGTNAWLEAGRPVSTGMEP
jgi:rhodanese-related sulfurtransferase